MSGPKRAESLTRCVVTRDHNEARIDVFLASATTLSRRASRRLLADGFVRMNGNPLRVQSRSVVAGDVIDVLLPCRDLGLPARPDVIVPEILFEDRWLLVANKPAGVLSASAENMRQGETSFDEQVLVAKAVEAGTRPFLRLFHRLDRVTSGAILFARHHEALHGLTAAWRDGRVERDYLAVVEGRPKFEQTVIEDPIARDRSHTWRFTTDPNGRKAVTEARVLARLDDDLAVVRCRLITGRTHQVRVHLASIGHPVLGDRLYGSERAGDADRPLLHAASLALPHPRTGDKLRVVCPAPEDVAHYLPE